MTSVAGAQTRPQPAGAAVRYGAAAGLSQPIGDAGDVLGTGLHVQGFAELRPATLPIPFRFELMYNRWGFDEDIGDGSASVLAGIANATYNITTQGNVRPFVIGGIGLYRSSTDPEGSDGDSSNDIGFNFGGGFRLPVGGLDSYIEARYHSVDDSEFIPIVFGVRF